MKIYVFALLVVAAVTFARQLPVEDLNEDEVPLDILDLPLASENKSSPIELHHRERRLYWPIYRAESVEKHHRERRIACDLLDGTGVGHAGCAAHCLGKGYRRGWCNDKGVCNCRN
ncbi:defensin-like [Temnothorax americanus]|uniref:defensin-like n=1 Tax=Temnothorax americanus TaxID=1964332 RepID=UPI0040698BB0